MCFVLLQQLLNTLEPRTVLLETPSLFLCLTETQEFDGGLGGGDRKHGKESIARLFELGIKKKKKKLCSQRNRFACDQQEHILK